MPKEDEEKRTEQALVEDDEFSKAFDEIVDEEENPDKDPTDTDDNPPVDPEPENQPEPEAIQPSDATPPDSEEEAAPAEPESAPAVESNDQEESAPSDDYRTKYEEAVARIEKMEQSMRSWEGRIKAANKRADEAEQKLKQKEQDKSSSTTTLPDGEDEAVLSDFIKEFPDLEKPIALIAKKMADQIVSERLKDVDQRVSTVQETVKEVSQKEHIDRITQAHPDWRQIYNTGALQKWIDTQPSFLQETYNTVVAEGSTDEIIDLFSMYKKAVGRPQSTPSHPTKTPTKKPPVEAVPASSGGPPPTQKSVSKDDFDSAWDEFTKSDK